MKRITYLMIALLALTGCLKDMTTTEFQEVELPVLVVPEDPSTVENCFLQDHQYVCKFGDRLKLVPDIRYSHPEDLQYVWKINGKTVNEDFSQKDLDWVCDLEKNAAGALYVIRTRPDTLKTIFSFSIALDQPYDRGWVVVADNGGKVHYNFLQEIIGRQYKFVEYPGFWKTETNASDWLGCQEFWSNESKAVYGHMLHLDKNLENCASVDEISMSQVVSLKQEFLGEKFPEGVNYFKSAVYGGYIAYLLGDNGKVYGRKGTEGYYSGRFFDLPLQYDGKDLEMSSFVSAPYNVGFVLLYDKKTGFKTINNAYDTGSNAKAGKISPIPVTGSGDLSEFKGDEIVYARFLQSEEYGGSPILFILSKSDSGQYRISEYVVNIGGNGVISSTSSNFVKKPVAHLGENSKITVLENPMGFVGGMVYFTDNDDPTILYSSKRSAAGLGEVKVYRKFNSPVIALDQGKIQPTSHNIGVALEDNTVSIMNLSNNKVEYVAPTEDSPGSYHYEGKFVEGKVIGLSFRYGKVSNYFK